MTDRSERDRRWMGTLLVLCGVALLVTFFGASDSFGLGGRPWYGWWDANVGLARPYVVRIASQVEGGAAARGGLRDGDLIDLREQSVTTRVRVLFQLPATVPTKIAIHRGSSNVSVAVTGSTLWEGQPVLKLATIVSYTLASIWFVGCALLIVVRRSARRDGRLLALVLLCITGYQLNPSFFVVPWPSLQLALIVVSQTCLATALLLLLRLSSGAGTRTTWRTILEWSARVVVLAFLVNDLLVVVGTLSLRLDPSPFVDRISFVREVLALLSDGLVVMSALAAVWTTPAAHRPRTAWTVLPLPLAMLTVTLVTAMGVFVVRTWFAIVTVAALGDAMWLLGAGIVTYALLKRRVLDFEFVLSRTLVVGGVSAIVVVSFVLLEWLLGTVLAGVSHATGLIANGALALVLGLSLNPIHKRVDALVETILFRKRHEDERALLDFSKEAAYVTDTHALLDQTMEKLERHTDARAAELLLNEGGEFVPARSYGNGSSNAIGENDPAILALKAWHRPVDPHHYSTAIDGALAVPMLARGRLLGVVVLGERTGGEAYAPDEVEAMSQFAHGVGSAIDVLSLKPDDSIASLRDSMATMAESIAALADETALLKRSMDR